MIRRPAPLAAAALCATLALSGCALLDKDTKPTRNATPTRASVEATRPTSTPTTARPGAGASGGTSVAPSSRRPAPAASSGAPVVVGPVASINESGWGPVQFGSPVTAGPTVEWLPSCQGWALKSSGGTVVGHAKTADGTQAGPVFAIRIDSPGVAGPSGVKVGAPASEFTAVHPRARSADAGGRSWLWTADTPTTFVAQLDKKGGTMQALMVLPAGQEAAQFSATPLCR